VSSPACISSESRAGEFETNTLARAGPDDEEPVYQGSFDELIRDDRRIDIDPQSEDLPRLQKLDDHGGRRGGRGAFGRLEVDAEELTPLFDLPGDEAETVGVR
jgi:hypothetical protein